MGRFRTRVLSQRVGKREEGMEEGRAGKRVTDRLMGLGSRTLPEQASFGKFYLVGLQQAGKSSGVMLWLRGSYYGLSHGPCGL